MCQEMRQSVCMCVYREKDTHSRSSLVQEEPQPIGVARLALIPSKVRERKKHDEENEEEEQKEEDDKEKEEEMWERVVVREKAFGRVGDDVVRSRRMARSASSSSSSSSSSVGPTQLAGGVGDADRRRPDDRNDPPLVSSRVPTGKNN